MPHEKIKSLFSSAVESVVSSISDYCVNPKRDFTRNKKLPADKLITFPVADKNLAYEVKVNYLLEEVQIA